MNRELRAAFTARLSRFRVTDDRDTYDDKTWPAPWVVIDWPPLLEEHARWEDSNRNRVTGRVQTNCVGLDTDQAIALHDAVSGLLLDWVPSVAGWSCFPLSMATTPRLLSPYRAAPDRVLLTAVCLWEFQANRLY